MRNLNVTLLLYEHESLLKCYKICVGGVIVNVIAGERRSHVCPRLCHPRSLWGGMVQLLPIARQKIVRYTRTHTSATQVVDKQSKRGTRQASQVIRHHARPSALVTRCV